MGSDVTLFLPSFDNTETEKSITAPWFFKLPSFTEGGRGMVKKKKTHTHIST